MFTLLDLYHLLCIFSPILRTFLSVYTHTHTSHCIFNVRNFYFPNWKSEKMCYPLFAATAAAAVGAWNVYQFVIVNSRFFFCSLQEEEKWAWHMLSDATLQHLALATWHLALWSRIEVDFAFLKYFFFFVFIYIYGLRKLWAQSAWTWPRLWLRAELQKPATTTIVVQFIFI